MSSAADVVCFFSSWLWRRRKPGGAREDLLLSGMAMLPPRFQNVVHLLAMVSLCFLSRASSLAMEMEEGHGDGSDSSFLGSSNSNIPALFLFGDSIADTGNNNWLFTLARADFPPYGRSFVDHVPTGRFSDGPLAVDYLATFLGLPFIPPYLHGGDNILHGVCFASAGSGILDSTGAFYGQHIPLSKQIDNFRDVKRRLITRLGPEQAALLISKSLHLIVTGSNDFFSYYDSSSISSSTDAGLPPAFEQNLLARFVSQLQDLYKVGARKMLVVSVPPLGCVPSMLYKWNGRCASTLNDAIRSYNTALLDAITSLQVGNLADAHLLYANAYDLALKILDNPQAFGFDDSRTACCGLGRFGGAARCFPLVDSLCSNSSTHVFWDYVHPTSAAYHAIAGRLWDGSADEILPFNLRQLSLLV